MKRATYPSVHSMAHRILAVAHAHLARPADDPVRQEGEGWYARARNVVEVTAQSVRDPGPVFQDPYLVERVAGALAALSPQVGWREQLKYHVPWIVATLKGDASVKVGPGLRANAEKARRILGGEHPNEVLGGLKVRAFYDAIMGDTFAVVVDRHAAAVALGAVPDSIGDRLYREVAIAYTAASVSVGMSPRDLQAITWCEWRATGTVAWAEAIYRDVMRTSGKVSS